VRFAEYEIAANTTIAAGAYLVLTTTNYGVGSGDPGVLVAFTLLVLGATCT